MQTAKLAAPRRLSRSHAALLVACALGLLAAPHARAQRQGGGPPPEAIAACENQEEGTECRFDGQRGAVEGVCRAPRGELVCVPNGHRPPPR